jgi:phage-related protein
MEPTITLEFTSGTRRHLHELEHELKEIQGVKVYFVEPRDESAPVLISLGLSRKRERAEMEIRRIAHVLYDFLHSSASEESQRAITLVTIEGESVDIAPLSSEEIREIIGHAYAGQ